MIKERLTRGRGPFILRLTTRAILAVDSVRERQDRGMRVQALSRLRARGRAGSFLWLPLAGLTALVMTAAGFVSYVLWPTWPGAPIPLGAPAVPVTVAGVLFEVPPAAIRVAMQRQPGPHERVDLVFLWPSLEPPQPSGKAAVEPAGETIVAPAEASAAEPPRASDRLFVTIAALGAVLPPIERLRTIYPRYAAAQATAGPAGLAILPFRAGTPYEGEDLVYVAEQPERFFARCSRDLRAVTGTCMQDRSLDAAEITLRFPRRWLDDWHSVADGFDRLVARLHPHAN
jgi:hypothetical protein